MITFSILIANDIWTTKRASLLQICKLIPARFHGHNNMLELNRLLNALHFAVLYAPLCMRVFRDVNSLWPSGALGQQHRSRSTHQMNKFDLSSMSSCGSYPRIKFVYRYFVLLNTIPLMVATFFLWNREEISFELSAISQHYRIMGMTVVIT